MAKHAAQPKPPKPQDEFAASEDQAHDAGLSDIDRLDAGLEHAAAATTIPADAGRKGAVDLYNERKSAREAK